MINRQAEELGWETEWHKPPQIIGDAKNWVPTPYCAAPFSAVVTYLLFTSNLVLVAFFLSLSGYPSVHFPSISPLLYVPLSMSLASPTSFLFLRCSPLLSPMSTAAENPAQTPACVFVHAAVRWICRQTSHAHEK